MLSTPRSLNGLDLLKVATAEPGDVSALEVLHAAGYTPGDVVAVVGKTEGNGCVNDFSRTLAARAWDRELPGVVTVMSGGTEGVLSPHVSLLVRQHDGQDASGLAGAVANTPPVDKPDLGRRAQSDAVALAVRTAMADAGLEASDVHLVLVKCPLLTSEDVAACLAAGRPPVATDTYASMARSRAASALGVALALGECTSEQVDASLAGTATVWSSTASCSSGAELADCHVLVLGAAPTGGRLGISHAVMRDALDLSSVDAVLEPVRRAGARVVQVFAKAEASPDGRVRVHRHTMLTDSDLHSTRHARAAVGGLLAALACDPAIYVSGGAENQGPAGGGPVTVVYAHAGPP